jgi:hypothetical protein
MKWVFTLLLSSLLTGVTLPSDIDSPISVFNGDKSTEKNTKEPVFENGLLPLPDGEPIVLGPLPLPTDPPPIPKPMPHPPKKDQDKLLVESENQKGDH